MEVEQNELCASLSDPEIYKNNPAEIARIKLRSETLAHDIAAIYRRWEELEGKRDSV
jgi:hypothetical protein